MKELSYDEIKQWISSDVGEFLLFGYTPICGTCKLALEMLRVVEMLKPNLVIATCNLNAMPKLAQDLQMMSVPYLAIYKQGVKKDEIYAFQSVPYLLERLNQN